MNTCNSSTTTRTPPSQSDIDINLAEFIVKLRTDDDEDDEYTLYRNCSEFTCGYGALKHHVVASYIDFLANGELLFVF
jgi:hypothetical protein